MPLGEVNWAHVFNTAHRYVRQHFASAVERYGLDIEEIAAEATMRTWETYQRRPDLRAEVLVFLMVRRVGMDHLRRANRRPLQVALAAGDEMLDVQAGESAAGVEEGLMWAAGGQAIAAGSRESVRQDHRDRFVFATQCRQVARTVAMRGAVSPEYRQRYAEDPVATVWGAVHELLAEFAEHSGDRLPPQGDQLRRRAYRIIQEVRRLMAEALVVAAGAVGEQGVGGELFR